jgi:hypothetical protein
MNALKLLARLTRGGIRVGIHFAMLAGLLGLIVVLLIVAGWYDLTKGTDEA